MFNFFSPLKDILSKENKLMNDLINIEPEINSEFDLLSYMNEKIVKLKLLLEKYQNVTNEDFNNDLVSNRFLKEFNTIVPNLDKLEDTLFDYKINDRMKKLTHIIAKLSKNMFRVNRKYQMSEKTVIKKFIKKIKSDFRFARNKDLLKEVDKLDEIYSELFVGFESLLKHMLIVERDYKILKHADYKIIKALKPEIETRTDGDKEYREKAYINYGDSILDALKIVRKYETFVVNERSILNSYKTQLKELILLFDSIKFRTDKVYKGYSKVA